MILSSGPSTHSLLKFYQLFINSKCILLDNQFKRITFANVEKKYEYIFECEYSKTSLSWPTLPSYWQVATLYVCNNPVPGIMSDWHTSYRMIMQEPVTKYYCRILASIFRYKKGHFILGMYRISGSYPVIRLSGPFFTIRYPVCYSIIRYPAGYLAGIRPDTG